LRWHSLLKQFNCLKTSLWHRSDSWWVFFLSDHSFRWQIELKFSKLEIELSHENTLCDQKKRCIVQNLNYALCFCFIRWERCMIASLLKKKLIKISLINTSNYWSTYSEFSDSNRVQYNFFSSVISWLKLSSTLITLSIVHYSLNTINLWTLH